MTNGLHAVQVKILTYGVYALMAFLTIVSGWTASEVISMQKEYPKEFVQLERYKEDLKSLRRIESKLDQLIMNRGGDKTSFYKTEIDG